MPSFSSSVTRREMLKYSGAFVSAAALGHHPASAAPTAKVDDISVITRQPHLYHGWPTLARRRNGELLVVCSGGRETHVCPFGRVEMIRSKDSGQKWSSPRVLLDGAIDDRDAGVLETANGSILVTTFTSLAYEPLLAQAEAKAGDKNGWSADKLARWQGARDRLTKEQRQNELGVWMLRSTDGGITFSSRYNCLVNSPHGPIQLSDGRLLYVGKQLWDEERWNIVCQSCDDGQTWSYLATIPTRDGDDRKDYHELHAVEAANGTLIAQIRNHNKQNARETLQTESYDGGVSWTMPHSIGVWGYPSHLLRLKDGRLMMSYGHRRAPLGNQARISADNGKSWSKPIIISGDASSGDLGYPSTVQIDDGSLVTVWYEKLKESPKAVLRQAHWELNG